MKHELFVTIGSKEHRVVLSGPQMAPHVSVDGDGPDVDGPDVDIQFISPRRLSVIVDGHSHLVDFDTRKRQSYLHIDGKQVTVANETPLAKRIREAAAVLGTQVQSGETLFAPIAGKVVKILVSLGETVLPGQGVLVLEAMKMENELKSENGGKVKSIFTSEGESVETAQKLLELT